MKRSIVLLVLLVAGCSQGAPDSCERFATSTFQDVTINCNLGGVYNGRTLPRCLAEISGDRFSATGIGDTREEACRDALVSARNTLSVILEKTIL